jgi:hypothetical protein
MYSLMGLEVAHEIQRDRVKAAEQRRAAQLAHSTLFARAGRRARKWRQTPPLQVGRARATAPSAPMGCTA